jgi:hypothetical protein
LDSETISFLRIQGIPAELRLDGWVAPGERSQLSQLLKGFARRRFWKNRKKQSSLLTGKVTYSIARSRGEAAVRHRHVNRAIRGS